MKKLGWVRWEWFCSLKPINGMVDGNVIFIASLFNIKTTVID